MNKKTLIRSDGKNKQTLLFLTILFGLFGIEYFYLNMNKKGWIKLGISWFGGTIIVLTWIIYGTNNTSRYDVVVGFSAVGGVIAGLSFLWTILNCFLVMFNTFRDEHNNPISSWDSNYETYINYLLDEGNYHDSNNISSKGK